MRSLRTDDPAEVGGHRLLARLGAGGMGVVYLARAGDGTLVALKVIRPEHAADPAFRARFRREVRLATGLTGRWVVPVTAADAEAAAPWLATAFVPGPALVEAVDGHGPLPPYAVAALGARLAEALAEVHAAGLVHRDVKPGNVLLALDGPRLIDFGIAHDSGATALTAPDAVIGTPGYLAPEQVRAGGRAGPPSDVFALGCVLAYAATGRRPYGTGNPAAVLYRTVHEPPDLTGLDRLLPRELAAAVAGCLAKNPAERPTAAELRTTLAAGAGPAGAPEAAGARADAHQSPDAGGRPEVEDGAVTGRAAGAGPVDPRVPAPPPPDPDTRVLRDEEIPSAETLPSVPSAPAPAQAPAAAPPAGTRDWLPSPVLRLVAERSARALDPPPRQAAAPADAVPPAPDATTAAPVRPGSSRRRFLVVGGSAAAALAASGAGAAALYATRGGAGGNGGAPHRLPLHAIALHAALTGGQKADGVAHERGARLAVARHNARDDARFRLSLVPYDDGGEAGRAREVVRKVLHDRSVRAVLGPTTAASLRVAAPRYAEESMPVVDVSVDTDAAEVSRKDAHSLVATRLAGSYHTFPILDYLTRVCGVVRTAVVEDRGADDGGVQGILRQLRESPPGEGETRFHPVAAPDGFGPAVAAALAERPEAVVYAGSSPERAAACARALAEAGFDGPRVSFEPVMRPAFLREAGDAGGGWVVGAPYTAAEQATSKAARAFTAAYRERYDGPPPRWAAEAYDAVSLIAVALDALGGGAEIVPGQVAERIVNVSHTGIAKPLRFAGQLVRMLQPDKAAFLYEVRNGEFRYLGRHDQVE